ncbi:hypothetical protein [Erythrobacter donghaensis]|uniref:hypothetical protein n=1 Tax=Erythrobacter donghaensis TaxID=267135 RepID=UPI001B80E78E|nr:hypothetical protein [Erythrobacter donghaensis]
MTKALWTGMACLALTACGGKEAAAPEPAATEAAVAADATPADTGDAKVAGTKYNATTMLPCGFDNAAPTQTCDAGVVRDWGEKGSHLVEVKSPDGFTRAIFFNGTEPFGADSAEADGSAGWDFKTSRDGDMVTVTFGPETYVIADALITGG